MLPPSPAQYFRLWNQMERVALLIMGPVNLRLVYRKHRDQINPAALMEEREGKTRGVDGGQTSQGRAQQEVLKRCGCSFHGRTGPGHFKVRNPEVG